MGIDVIWDNEAKTIIRYVYDGRWTWEDFDKARALAVQLEDTVPHQVDAIVDVQKSSVLPTGTITRAREVGGTAPVLNPKEGISVIVGAGAFVRSIYDVLRKVYPELIRRRGLFFAKSLDEARAIIAQHVAQRTSTAS